MLDWVIGTGVAVSLLIVFVLLIRRPFARMFGARAAYALWLLPFIRLILPEGTIPRIFPKLGSAPVPEAAPSVDIMVTPDIMAALQAPPSLMSQAEPYIVPALFALWAFGAVFFFLYHWTSQASFMDRLTYASEPANELRKDIALAAEATGLKRVPQVRISDEKAGPLVAGFFHPIVILPDNFMGTFSSRQRRYALMHEFMHIKRGDVWVALAWLALRAVNWPNPLVHYAAKHFRSDQEAACDASVLSVMGDTKESVTCYAETLIQAAKAAINDGRASPQPGALALTIHHPLKERLMILGTHKKISHWRSRTAAAVMIIGAACVSAPLIQADAHPEEELAGKHQPYTQHKGRTVIKRTSKDNGKTVSEHFEINVDGDDVKAYKVDPSGKKTRIDVKDIEGVDVADVIEEKNEGDMRAWVSKKHKGKIILKDKDGEVHVELKSFPEPPDAPFPPGFSKHSENVFVLDSDDFPELKSLKRLETLKGLKGLEKLESLKTLKSLEGLKGLEQLEALKELKNLDGFETYSFFHDENSNVKLKMRMTESKLAAALAMLEDTEVEAGDSREMAKAKRELEKARKALKAAERALKDAE